MYVYYFLVSVRDKLQEWKRFSGNFIKDKTLRRIRQVTLSEQVERTDSAIFKLNVFRLC